MVRMWIVGLSIWFFIIFFFLVGEIGVLKIVCIVFIFEIIWLKVVKLVWWLGVFLFGLVLSLGMLERRIEKLLVVVLGV